MFDFYKSFSKTAVALSFFTALTSAAQAQAVIMDDQVVNSQGSDVVMIPEGDGILRSRGSIVDDKIGLNIQMGIGRMDVTSHEYVYDGAGNYGGAKGRKISELIWKSENVVMLGGKMSVELMSRMNFYGEAWLNVHDKSHMDDYDWLYPDKEWSHWSGHDKTELDQGYILDVALGFTAFKTDNIKFDLLAGYKRDSWRWKGYGGKFIYSDMDNGGFRDIEARDSETNLAITYYQQYNTPYLGASASMDFGRLNLSGKAIGSNWVSAKSRDSHHNRSLSIADDLHNGSMYMLEGEASFAFSEMFSAGLGYSYTQYSKTKGEARYTKTDGNGGGYYYVEGDTAGAESESSMIKVFLNSKF